MITVGRGLLVRPYPSPAAVSCIWHPWPKKTRLCWERHSPCRSTCEDTAAQRVYRLTTGQPQSKRWFRAPSSPKELARPGHVFPLYAAENGVLERNGHTEALLDLTRMAGMKPGGALIEILNPDGTMARLPQLEEIAREHGLKIVSINHIIEYRITNKT